MSYSQVNIVFNKETQKVKSENDLWQFICVNTSDIAIDCDITLLLTNKSQTPIYHVIARQVNLPANATVGGIEISQFKDSNSVVDDLRLKSILSEVSQICLNVNYSGSQFEVASFCKTLTNGLTDTSEIIENLNNAIANTSGQVSVTQYFNLNPNQNEPLLLRNQFNGNLQTSIIGLPLQMQFFNAFPAEYFGFKPAVDIAYDTLAYKNKLINAAETKLKNNIEASGLNYNQLLSKIDAYEQLVAYTNIIDSSLLDSALNQAQILKSELLNKAHDSLNTIANSIQTQAATNFDSVKQCYIDTLEIQDSLNTIQQQLNSIDSARNSIDSIKQQILNTQELLQQKDQLYSALYKDSVTAGYVKQLEAITAIKNGNTFDFSNLVDSNRFFSPLNKALASINDLGAGQVSYNIDDFVLNNISVSGFLLDYQLNEQTSTFGLAGYIRDEFDYFTAVNSFTNTSRIVIGGVKRKIGELGEYTMALEGGRNFDTTITFNQHWDENNILFNKYQAFGLEDGLFDFEAAMSLSVTQNNSFDYGQQQSGNWIQQVISPEGSLVNNTYSGFATRIGTLFHLNTIQSKLNLSHEFVNQSYFTAANPFLLTGLQKLEAGVNTQLKKWETELETEIVYNLFFPEKASSRATGILQYKALINTNPTEDINILINYYPNVIILNKEKTIVTSSIGAFTYKFLIKEFPTTGILTFVNTSSVINSIEYNENKFVSNAVMILCNTLISKDFSTGLQMQFNEVKSDTAFSSFSIGQNVSVIIKEKIQLNGNYSIPVYSNLSDFISFNLNATYLFNKLSIGAGLMQMEYNVLNYGLSVPTQVLWGNIFCSFILNKQQ